MPVEIPWLTEVMPLWAFILVFVLAYAILTKIKILGESKAINSIIAIILSIIFISFTSVREYVTNVTPWFALLLVVLFFFFLMIAFMIKNPESFTKPLTIVFIIIFSLILTVIIFYNFPDARAILPSSIACDIDNCDNYHDCDRYDYDCDGYNYFDEDKCYRYGDDYRCYSSGHYYWYDKCYRDGDYYRCHDSDCDDYDFECDRNDYDCDDYHDCDSYDYDCYDYRYDCDDYGNCYGNETTDKIRNWLYKDEIKNSFYLILAAAIVCFIITRK